MILVYRHIGSVSTMSRRERVKSTRQFKCFDKKYGKSKCVDMFKIIRKTKTDCNIEHP